MAGDAVGLAAVNLCFLAAGAGVTGAAGWWSGVRGLVRAVPFAYLVGVAAYGVVAQALLVLGAPLSAWQVVAVCALLAAGVALRRGSGERRPTTAAGLLALPACAMLVLLAIDLWFQPLWAYDAWTFWTPKARALAALDGLDAAWFTSADLLNRDYPLWLPAVEAAGFQFTGYETKLLDLQSWLVLCAFVLACAHLLAGRARPLAVWTVLTVVVFAPSLANQLAAAEADVPVAVLFATAGLCGYFWLAERDTAALVLAAVLGAGAVAAKIEGAIFVAALFVVLTVLAARRDRRAGLLTLGAGGAAFAVGLAPWRIWMALHDVPSQASLGRVGNVGFLARRAERVPEALAEVAVRALDPRQWLVLVPLALFGIVVAARGDRHAAALLAAAVGCLALGGLVLAYWSTPLDFDYHLATSARRVVSGPVLFWAVLTPVLLGARTEAERAPRREEASAAASTL